MGILGLLKIVKGKVISKPDGRIGVDALIILIESLTSGPILKCNNKVTLHIGTLVRKLINMPNSQVWVFDNLVKCKAKEETVKRRKFRMEVFDHITLGEAIKDLKQILTMCGIPFLVSPEEVEAEAYLVEMKRMGLIDYILTKDTDVLAYGEDMLTFKDKVYTLYKIDDILNDLSLTLDLFRRLCCHLGNDFNVKTKGISAEKMIDHIDKPLSDRQVASYIIFSIRYFLKYKDNIDHIFPKVPNVKKNEELIIYLKELKFKKLVETLSVQ
jgi:hypothetical protein